MRAVNVRSELLTPRGIRRFSGRSTGGAGVRDDTMRLRERGPR
ncbi:hypothetical protein B005_5177 [Nocardiopsis alba ATCC BAA-2165]|uniref:Uncharacterized protein n=1 Tax=Nocardiopsis alba (strain ATCC BAA-2165 / BE74) TaxID=1205910 RepID=J7KZX7_NOCAA|nr:hypothetical protein B005_5177 [Nocardiopsis alba ATCC BAA-2165]